MASVITAMALVIVVLVMVLKSEWGKRHEAEERAEEAKHNVEVLTQAQKIAQEARHEADKKIDEVRSSGSERDRYDAIMRGMCNNGDDSPPPD